MTALIATEDYFEQAEFWGHEPDAENRLRVECTAAAIPDDVQTLLDVGCGDGVVLNYLQRWFPGRFTRLVGVDTSATALQHVETESLQASIFDLPFETHAFDGVTCLEVLEHLPYDKYLQAREELARVARSRLLISVPHHENLAASHVSCPECGCSFCPHGHVRQFRDRDLQGLFAGFELTHFEYIGRRRQYPLHAPLARLARRLKLVTPYPATAICPQCQYRPAPALAARRSASRGAGRLAALKGWIPHWVEGRWLLALYTRS